MSKKNESEIVKNEIGRSKDNKTVVTKIGGEILILKSSLCPFGSPKKPNILSRDEIREYKKKSDEEKGPARLAQERKDDRKRCKLFKEMEKFG